MTVIKGISIFLRVLYGFIMQSDSVFFSWIVLVVVALVIVAVLSCGPAAMAKYLFKAASDTCDNVFMISCFVFGIMMTVIIFVNDDIQPGNKTKKHALEFNVNKKAFKSEAIHEDDSQNNDISSDYDTEEEMIGCLLCQGSGKCGVCQGFKLCGGCHGRGTIYYATVHSPGEYIDCDCCNGSGRCGNCDGSGLCQECDGKGKVANFFTLD